MNFDNKIKSLSLTYLIIKIYPSLQRKEHPKYQNYIFNYIFIYNFIFLT